MYLFIVSYFYILSYCCCLILYQHLHTYFPDKKEKIIIVKITSFYQFVFVFYENSNIAKVFLAHFELNLILTKL